MAEEWMVEGNVPTEHSGNGTSDGQPIESRIGVRWWTENRSSTTKEPNGFRLRLFPYGGWGMRGVREHVCFVSRGIFVNRGYWCGLAGNDETVDGDSGPCYLNNGCEPVCHLYVHTVYTVNVFSAVT